MSLEADQHEHHPTVLGLGAVALIGALLQIIAVVALGLAKAEALQLAAAENPQLYLLGALFMGLALTGAFILRAHRAIALPLALGWPLPLWLGLRGRTTTLGLAYHGELMLYHFLTFVAAATVIAITAQWALGDDRLTKQRGPLRFAPLATAAAGSVCLLVAHLASHPAMRVESMHGIGAVGSALLLLTWPIGLAVVWPLTERAGPRIAAILLMLPVLVRLIGARQDAFNGGVVHPEWVFVLGLTIVVVSGLVAGLIRPQLERWLHGVIAAVCMFATAFCWALYHYGFGALEDGLDGLIRSFLGFSIPYPAYVADWKVLGMMLGFFFILVTVYGTMVSTRERPKGLALALMTVAGLGLSSPHLVLLFGSGALLLVDALRCVPPTLELDAEGLPAPVDVDDLLEGLADRLGLAEPVITEDLVSLQGTVDGTRIDLRGRRQRDTWRLELTAGHPGRARPRVELIPDPGEGGTRPAHLLSRTHRVVGEVRDLETMGDRPLDALTSFPRARVRMWEGGATIDLGRDLAELSEDRLESLIRAFARVI